MSTVLERNNNLVNEKPGYTGYYCGADILEDEACEGIRPVVKNIAKVIKPYSC